MLQAVVRHQHVDVGMRGQQRPARLRAVAPHHHGAAAALEDQQRLVAHLLRRGAGADGARRAVGAAVAARNHARAHAGVAQGLHQPDRQRRLAGAANKDIADDDDGHGQALGFQQIGAVQAAPHGAQAAEQQGNGPQRARQRPARQPGAGKSGFKLGGGGCGHGVFMKGERKGRLGSDPAGLTPCCGRYLLPPACAANVSFS
ncbi:hypothetical protein JaAD80_25995 [Janthinobacterium sp. AD80]|nr:hypothetical protein JaAD80_25995 [Janthinobacterium sp. AD80]